MPCSRFSSWWRSCSASASRWASIGSTRPDRSTPTRSSTSRRATASATSPISWSRKASSSTPLTFIAGSLLTKSHEELRFGEYQFTQHASLHDVLNTLVSNKVVQHQITLPEGLTSEQMVQHLLETDILTGNIREIPREGSMLPESYRFPRGTPRDQVVQRMQQTQKRVVQEVWDHRAPDLPLRTPDQLVMLASIVEKETGRADERSRIAAVFVNRLKQHMRLQSDPTIIYGLVGGKGTLGRPIMRSEIEQPTPYNTYVIEGLPPGPDRQSRARGARSGRQSGPHQGALLRRRRHRRAHLLRDPRPAPAQRLGLRALEQQQRDGATAAVATDPFAAAPAAAAPAPAARRAARQPPAPR